MGTGKRRFPRLEETNAAKSCSVARWACSRGLRGLRVRSCLQRMHNCDVKRVFATVAPSAFMSGRTRCRAYGGSIIDCVAAFERSEERRCT